MARRSVRVTANVRKSQETRSQTRPLSTFPYVQNAPSVVQARLRGVRARRRLLRRASAGHNKKININKLNRDIYIDDITTRMQVSECVLEVVFDF